MQQQQRFLECKQDAKLLVRDYLCCLRNIADTVGDVDEREMVRQFWMNCQPYIRASLVDKGYEPNTVDLDTIEHKSLRVEQAYLENSKDPNVLLAFNPTLVASYASGSNPTRRRNLRPYRPSTHDRTDSIPANAVSESSAQRNRQLRPRQKPPNRSYGTSSTPKRNTDQIKWLHELNQCFECKQTGHLAKDCPK